MMRWAPEAPALTDTDIVRVTLRTLTYWRPLVGVDVASRIAVAKMRRLHDRSAS